MYTDENSTKRLYRFTRTKYKFCNVNIFRRNDMTWDYVSTKVYFREYKHEIFSASTSTYLSWKMLLLYSLIKIYPCFTKYIRVYGWRKRLARCASHHWNQAWWVMFHVREFPHLISPVLWGFFSDYSGFPPSLKSIKIGHLRATSLSVYPYYCHVLPS